MQAMRPGNPGSQPLIRSIFAGLSFSPSRVPKPRHVATCTYAAAERNIRTVSIITAMSRKIALCVTATVVVAILLAIVLTPKGPSPAQAVSIYIESLTNPPGFPGRMACMVITNQSKSTFRLLGWATWLGPLPTTPPQKRSGFSPLPAWSSMRVLISAPTNGQLWCGTVAVAPDHAVYQIGQNLLKSPFDVVKGTASLLMPGINVEDLFTSPSSLLK